ncbi:hypothetical protein RYX36_002004 [Vicia faba]
MAAAAYKTAEEIVDHLRSNYPDYHRTKYQTLIRFVDDALQHSNNTPTRNHNQNNNAEEDDHEDENPSASRKRRKEINGESQDRLQKMEALHIKPRMSTQASSTSSGSASGAVSTSEDGIYSDKVEPAFDLVNDMLRHSYTGAKSGLLVVQEKNVELDIGNTSKATITVNADGSKSKSISTTGKHSKGSVSNTGGGGGVEVKGKEGPKFKDLGGMKAIIEELVMDIVSLCNPWLPRHLGVKPVTGILLHGPPGCGKTRLAHAIANETGLPFHHISATEGIGMNLESGFLLYGPPGCGKTLIAKAVANEAGANFIHIKGPELLNKYVGESELSVRTLFSRARTCAPCVLFFDEVDALTTEHGKEGEWVIERLLNQLLIELDGAESRRGVFVIGATNRPEVMDRALMRPGRFGKLLYVPLPSPDDRVLILKALARNKNIDSSVDLSAIGRMESCENLSGADLAELMNEAVMAALDEKLSSAETTSLTISLTIRTSHFELALSKASPSVSDKQRQYYERLSKSLRAA